MKYNPKSKEARNQAFFVLPITHCVFCCRQEKRRAPREIKPLKKDLGLVRRLVEVLGKDGRALAPPPPLVITYQRPSEFSGPVPFC